MVLLMTAHVPRRQVSSWDLGSQSRQVRGAYEEFQQDWFGCDVPETGRHTTMSEATWTLLLIPILLGRFSGVFDEVWE